MVWMSSEDASQSLIKLHCGQRHWNLVRWIQPAGVKIKIAGFSGVEMTLSIVNWCEHWRHWYGIHGNPFRCPSGVNIGRFSEFLSTQFKVTRSCITCRWSSLKSQNLGISIRKQSSEGTHEFFEEENVNPWLTTLLESTSWSELSLPLSHEEICHPSSISANHPVSLNALDSSSQCEHIFGWLKPLLILVNLDLEHRAAEQDITTLPRPSCLRTHTDASCTSCNSHSVGVRHTAKRSKFDLEEWSLTTRCSWRGRDWDESSQNSIP